MIKRKRVTYTPLTNENLNPTTHRTNNSRPNVPIKHQEITNYDTSPEIPRMMVTKQKRSISHQKLTGNQIIPHLEAKARKIEQELAKRAPHSATPEELKRDLKLDIAKIKNAIVYFSKQTFSPDEKVRQHADLRLKELNFELADINQVNNLRKRKVSTENKIVTAQKVEQKKQVPHKMFELQKRVVEINEELTQIQHFMSNPFKEPSESKRKTMWEDAAKRKRALEHEQYKLKKDLAQLGVGSVFPPQRNNMRRLRR